MELRFQLTLKSDYHLSAGFGLNSQVDSSLLRDGDQVPVLRGTTIEGILRDGLWRLLQTAPALKQQFEPHALSVANRLAKRQSAATAYCETAQVCPLCRIFGSPVSPKRWRVSSARPAGATAPFSQRNQWEKGVTGAAVAARVRINPRMRRAEPRKLFKQEEGDRRLTFTFTLSCESHDPITASEGALLVAAARMVRRFGSSRRRGRGECAIHLIAEDGTPDQTTEAELLNQFQQTWLSATQPAPAIITDAVWALPTSGADNPLRFRVIVRADEPVVVARRAEAGNMFDCLDYINGSTLWGALANEAATRWRLRRREDNREDQFYQTNDAYRAFVGLLLRGLVRVSALYPASYVASRVGTDSLYPTIPAPLDLLTCKTYRGFSAGDGNTDHHGARGYAVQPSVPQSCERCNEPLVPLNDFLPIKDEAQRIRGAKTRSELHPRINPQTQRVATGDLFGYVALESGQYFIGELWCQSAATWQALCELNGKLKKEGVFQLRLGKATRRGYGLVSVWIEDLTSGWRGLPIEQRVTSLTDPITMTLLTDAIVTDTWGRFHQSLDREALCGIFKDHLAPASITPINSFCQTRAVDSFNNHLGLPRWRDLALQAGSAAGFTLQGVSDLYVLKRIESEGIGLRRHEGFGQVVFNHPLYKGGAGITGTNIPIRDAVKLSGPSSSSIAATIKNNAEQIAQWSRDLLDEEQFTSRLYSDPRWDAIARWLYTATGCSISDLQTQLRQFGSPSLLTSEPREPKEFFDLRAIDEIAQQLAQAQKIVAEHPEVNDSRHSLDEAKANVQNWKRLESVLETCKQLAADWRSIADAEPARRHLLSAARELERLNDPTKDDPTKAAFQLNDLLDRVAQANSSEQAKKLQLLADRIAAVKKEK